MKSNPYAIGTLLMAKTGSTIFKSGVVIDFEESQEVQLLSGDGRLFHVRNEDICYFYDVCHVVDLQKLEPTK